MLIGDLMTTVVSHNPPLRKLELPRAAGEQRNSSLGKIKNCFGNRKPGKLKTNNACGGDVRRSHFALFINILVICSGVNISNRAVWIFSPDFLIFGFNCPSTNSASF
jgi:hypothetical protein